MKNDISLKLNYETNTNEIHRGLYQINEKKIFLGNKDGTLNIYSNKGKKKKDFQTINAEIRHIEKIKENLYAIGFGDG